MHLSLIPMTNKSHVRLIFAKDVCVFTLKRSVKSILFFAILVSLFWFIVLFYRTSKSTIITTITTKTSIKPIPKEPPNQNSPTVNVNGIVHVNETVSNVTHQTLSKKKDVNEGAIGRKFKPVSVFFETDFPKRALIERAWFLEKNLSKLLWRQFAFAMGIRDITDIWR